MTFLLILLALALVAIVSTVRLVALDGYRRLPDRREADASRTGAERMPH